MKKQTIKKIAKWGIIIIVVIGFIVAIASGGVLNLGAIVII